MVAVFASVLAALVIGHPVPVTCAPVPGAFGYYDAAGDHIYINDGLCPYLDGTPRTKLARLRFALVALVVTHEAEHAAGVEDEHATECAALRALPAVLAEVKRESGALWSVGREAKAARSVQRGDPPRNGGHCAP